LSRMSSRACSATVIAMERERDGKPDDLLASHIVPFVVPDARSPGSIAAVPATGAAIGAWPRGMGLGVAEIGFTGPWSL
jgi:hypothetical protein